MKKFMALLMSLTALLAFSACEFSFNSGEEEAEESTETQEEETVEVKTTISLNKTSFEAGEDIVVTYDLQDEVQDNAWLGIIPADAAHGTEAEADKVDVAYKYLNSVDGTTITFSGISKAGSYQARLYSTDSNGVEVASSDTFTIEGETEEEPERMDPVSGKVSIDNEEYIPGAEIIVNFTASESVPKDAWVGIIPSSVEHGTEEENDKHDLQYKYLNGVQEGTLTFTAPDEPGEYDFRMNESDKGGVEIDFVSFTVISQ